MGMSNSDRWKNIQHLEIAVGCIRSLMFFSCHKDDCCTIYSEDEFVNGKYEKFILEASYVLDNFCKIKNRQEKNIKSILCAMYLSIEKIYYERDKNVAHKDKNYKAMQFASLDARIAIMEKMVDDIRSVCSEILSEKYKAIYFPYDDELRFCVYQVTRDIIDKYRKIVEPLSIGRGTAYLCGKLGVEVKIPGDACETATKIAFLLIKKNIDNDTDIWDNVYENMREPYEEFYTQILPKMKNALS